MKRKAKKQKPEPRTEAKDTSGYDFIDATCDGSSMTMRYQVSGLTVKGSDRIDEGEDLSDWTDDDIKKRICDHLDIDHRFADEIDLEWCSS